jgi:hypothetical protein
MIQKVSKAGCNALLQAEEKKGKSLKHATAKFSPTQLERIYPDITLLPVLASNVYEITGWRCRSDAA